MDKSFLSLLTFDYKLDMTEEQYTRLTDILTMYEIEPTALHIEVQSDYASFINNIHLTKKIDFRRAHTSIELEDVIYQMIPEKFGCYESIQTIYPAHIKHTIDHCLPFNEEYKRPDQNMVLIRTLSYDSDHMHRLNERYTLMIYNKKLNVHAGIRFEKI